MKITQITSFYDTALGRSGRQLPDAHSGSGILDLAFRWHPDNYTPSGSGFGNQYDCYDFWPSYADADIRRRNKTK